MPIERKNLTKKSQKEKNVCGEKKNIVLNVLSFW